MRQRKIVAYVEAEVADRVTQAARATHQSVSRFALLALAEAVEKLERKRSRAEEPKRLREQPEASG